MTRDMALKKTIHIGGVSFLCSFSVDARRNPHKGVRKRRTPVNLRQHL
jgi:hypothetical protein